jgi:hypothetical protein
LRESDFWGRGISLLSATGREGEGDDEGRRLSESLLPAKATPVRLDNSRNG